jgi:hypothetical protein
MRKGLLRFIPSSTPAIAFIVMACGPRAHIPPLPLSLGPSLGVVDSLNPVAQLARELAPLLYMQTDEKFPLDRVVAVKHPDRRVIAYHLLWRDDVNGSWIPFTVPTDEEVVWVGYDNSRAPTDLWTYWHGTLLHTDWRNRGPVIINVQWGKHGSLPRGVVESDLPASRTLNLFYAFTWISIPDMLLGRLTRPGPVCFCRGYRRYRDFSRPLMLSDRIDAVAETVDAKPVLEAVFGRPYSRKVPWPHDTSNAP